MRRAHGTTVPMLRTGALATALIALVGCELLTGISDKTLVSSGRVGVPCSQQQGYLFCDDFDAEPTLGQPWEWHSATKGGALSFDTADYATPPHSAQCVAPAGAIATAQLGRDVGVLSHEFGVTFDLRIDAASATDLPEASVAQVLTTGTGLSINYVLGPGNACSLQVFDTSGGSGAPVVSVELPFPPLRTWTNIALESTPQGVSVVEDGQSIGSSGALPTGAPGDTTFIVGIVSVVPFQPGATSAITLELDDVVLRGN